MAMAMAEVRELLTLDLQRFADGEGEGGNVGAESSGSETGSNDNGASERIAELEKQLAESSKKYDKLKGTLDSKLKELGDMTKKERERMTAEELERKQIEEIKEQNAMLLKEREIANAERRFIQNGCDAELASDGAKALIEQDYDALFDVIGKLVDNRIAGEKTQLLKTMPKPQGGGSSSTMTQEQFDKMNYKERVELLEKDPETYNKFK